MKKIFLLFSLLAALKMPSFSQTVVVKGDSVTVVDNGSLVLKKYLTIPGIGAPPSGSPATGWPRKGGTIIMDTVNNVLWGWNSSAWVNLSGSTYTGTTNRITVSSGVIDIAATYIGQSSITTVGTIATGLWQGSVIAAGYGGTGQSTFTIGDILYASGTTTLSKLAAGTNGYVLTSNGPGSAPSWQASSGGGGTVTSVGITGSDFTIVNTPITGSGNISLTLATVNSNVGTFNNVTVNAKGLVTAASNVTYLTNVTGYVTAGTGISISGSGTSGSPYVISSTHGVLRTTASGTTITDAVLSGKTIELFYIGDDVKNSGWTFSGSTITLTDGTTLASGTGVTVIYN